MSLFAIMNNFINNLVTFLSILLPGRTTVAPILTLNGSNDVFPPRDGLLSVTTMGDVIL